METKPDLHSVTQLERESIGQLHPFWGLEHKLGFYCPLKMGQA